MLKDKDIREPLFDFLEEQYGKVRIIEEKTMQTPTQDFHARLKITIAFLIEIMLLPVRNMLIMWENMYRSGGALLR